VQISRKKLLLHTCCAPCFSHVYEVLKDSYNVTSYFYNPNISPRDEYEKRLSELKRYAEEIGFQLIVGSYDIRDWTQRVKPFRFMGERSERCWNCYHFRLEKTFIHAVDEGYDIVATSLSISPHKDAYRINKSGNELEKKYGIPFLTADFKKKDGFKKSVELSKKHGFYRQNYCGCIYSKMERETASVYYTK